MKKGIFLFFAMAMTVSLWSQSRVFPVVNRPPEFPGGSDALVLWIERNLHYPVLAEEQQIEGKVICAFWVEKDGSIKNPYVVKSAHDELSKEALRVLKFMPRWNPGRKNGQAVRERYTIPFTFRLVPDSIYNKKKDM